MHWVIFKLTNSDKRTSNPPFYFNNSTYLLGSVWDSLNYEKCKTQSGASENNSTKTMWITDLGCLPWNRCIERKILKGLVSVQIIARIVPSSISKTTVYTFGFVYDWIIGIGMRRRLVGSTSAKTTPLVRH